MGLSLSEVALFGILGGLTFAAKVAMAGLPNIEPVSLMVMLFAVTFGRKAVYPIYVYVLMEFVLYGLNLWSINYLYVWIILAGAAWLCRGDDQSLWLGDPVRPVRTAVRHAVRPGVFHDRRLGLWADLVGQQHSL